MKRKSLILTALVAALLVWALVCAAIGGKVPADVVLRRLSSYIIAFTVFGACFTMNRKVTGTVLFLILALWGLYECGVGVAQLEGWMPSKHNLFKITGSFLNPGPYGGFLAMVATACFSVFIKKDSALWLKVIAAVTMLFSAVMMAISESRSSWMGTIIAIAVILQYEKGLFSKIRRKFLFWGIAGVIGVAAVLVAYQMKPESAQCRVFLWHMDCRAIVDSPLTGAGPGAEMGAYGKAQHDFFTEDVRSEKLIKLADCPQFAFNEFLRCGMATGVPGMLLMIAVYALALCIMIKRRSIFTGAWIALGIFSLFSFPLSRPLMCVLTAALLAESAAPDGMGRTGKIIWGAVALAAAAGLSTMAVKQAQSLKMRERILKETNDSEKVVKLFESNRDKSLDNTPEILFYYARAVYALERTEEASDILLRAEEISPDPQVHSLRSECQRLTGNFKDAETELVYAHYMVPIRLTPLFFLERFYASIGMMDKARAVRDYALTVPFDESQTGTAKIKKQILELDI